MSELFSQLGIDWKILIAQAVNFAVLLFVLRKFAYRPILKILEERRAAIENDKKRSEELSMKLAEAEKAKEEILAQARIESEKIIKAAEEAGKEDARNLIAEAREENKRAALETEKNLERERERLFAEAKREIGELVTTAVEKTLAGALDKKSEMALVDEALRIVNSEHSK